ncbi:hypothetical protein [Hymenobacter cellulosilyticus]|uniref:Uncharacterized protein n=1 Tax=Hymenobacter cellulosilyticus TaxID=2932248 RepID=A0A8T9PXP3_9BACT|nr:hypothetical protein [Hymenobacter cellulosilyticus]UOQ70166.1 hypothetical protein MUN79_15495 [Hymenobacter cellulosilyticus]
MPLYECVFSTLSIDEQLQALWAEGTYLAARWVEQDRIYLYHMGAFFAEVYCDFDQKKLSTRAFTSPQNLEAYVAYIGLEDLKH